MLLCCLSASNRLKDSMKENNKVKYTGGGFECP